LYQFYLDRQTQPTVELMESTWRNAGMYFNLSCIIDCSPGEIDPGEFY
jgi:hypothetical protein